ncbi:MAG: hypothetical protein ACHP8A_10910 [Terriglobales bacterium]|jgi:hypothetical protein|nr:hypothetical protein [Terriglobales bacterium]
MDAALDDTPRPKLLLNALPAIHVVLFAMTLITERKTASGGNPLLCVELPISLPLIATDQWPTVFVVGTIATFWWYFIAQIGWSSKRKRLSRLGAGLGALLVSFICLIDGVMMFSELRCCISQESNFSVVDWIIYVMAGALLCGGLISASYSASRALGFNKA